jgi:membrane protein DedA with SNARE-associated domain
MSFPAGAARMRFGRFLGLSALGGVPWIIFWGVLGRALGSHYHQIERNLHYVDIVGLVAIVGVIAWLVVRRRRRTLAA